MSRSDDELERLKRLRERQLRARNPNAKAEAQQRRISEHHRKNCEAHQLAHNIGLRSLALVDHGDWSAIGARYRRLAERVGGRILDPNCAAHLHPGRDCAGATSRRIAGMAF